MKVLITGKRDKLWKAVGSAFSRQTGFSVNLLPAGSQLVEALHSAPVDAVLYTLSDAADLELLRWVLKINPAVPLIAVVPSTQARLKDLADREGAAQVVSLSALGSTQIRSSIAPLLRKLASKSGTETRQQISNDLHAIRSALTSILGNAEMALKQPRQTTSARKRLEAIPRGVGEIEQILRRLHHTVRTRPLETPPQPLRQERRTSK